MCVVQGNHDNHTFQVDGVQTEQSLCIGKSFTQLAIVAKNSVGIGERFAVYSVPAATNGTYFGYRRRRTIKE